MLTTKTIHGELRFSDELIFELVSSIIVQIPGVSRIKHYKISDYTGKNPIRKKIVNRKNSGQIISKDAINIKWDTDKNTCELCLYLVLNNLNSIHTITSSICDRLTFEFEKKLKMSNVNIKIFIEDFEDKQ